MAKRGEDASSNLNRISLAQVARRVLVVIAATLAGLILLQVLTAVLMLTRFAPDAARYTRAAAASSLSHTGMLDEETALRAFLVARDQAFLDPYTRGQREVADGNLQLASLVSSDRALNDEFVAVVAAQQSWSTGWASPALTSADVATGAILPEFLVRGKLLFDAYRQSESRFQAAIVNAQTASFTAQNNFLAASGAVALLLVVVVVVLGALGVNRLRRELTDPVNRLTVQVEQLVAGHYDSRVEDAGRVSEFAPISGRLDELAQTLQDLSGAAAARETDKLAQAARLRQLLELTRDIAGSLSLRYTVRAVGQSALKIAAFEAALVWLVDEENHKLIPTYLSEGPDGQPMGVEALELGASLPGLAAKYGQAFRRVEPSDPPAGFQPELTRSAIAVPMIVGARCIGVIELTSTAERLDTEPDIPVIETLAIHAGAAIEAARLHHQSEQMAQVDALTRLLNRRRLDDDLEKEVARAVRYSRPLAFVMLDTDHFKKLNDNLGHQRGDLVLQQVAAILGDGLRTSDTAYRYGGEEFALILRESTAGDALIAAERLRSRIEQRFGGPGNAANVTASFGVASLGPGVETASDLVGLADQALYQAKQAGRNRVVVASDERERPAVLPVA